ncbi:MAG: hypothetical protein IT436_03875 [Phycisphaerales bacterium]|nr:hypothetical protein [Phycisphaerales bacterium]
MLNALPLIFIFAARAVCAGPPASGPAAPAEGAPVAVATPAEELPDRYEAAEVKGFRAMIRADWARSRPLEARRVRTALETDLTIIEAAVPGPAMTVLRSRVTIWISPSLEPREGFTGRGMCFHESAGWVAANGLGAERAGGIEICNADDYLLWRAEQPMMVLHELAHAYHAAIRPGDGDIRAAFERAVAAGKYERVAHVLAGPGELRRAYALNNDREYFAELTEACFGRNDFAPMTRAELAEVDPEGLAVIERAWSSPPGPAPGAAPAGSP